MIGDTTDIVARIRSALPLAWFPSPPGPGEPETAPVLVAVLTGIATPLSGAYALIAYARAQMRLATASGTTLDLMAIDYFGITGLQRQAGEADAAYAARIRAARFPDRNTRGAVTAAETLAIGAAPLIVEPMRAADTKGYGGTSSPAAGGGYGYGCGGLRYGSRLHQDEIFIEAPRCAAASAVVAAVNSTRPVATRAWVRVLNS